MYTLVYTYIYIYTYMYIYIYTYIYVNRYLSGVGFRVSDLGFRVQGFGFRVCRFRVQGPQKAGRRGLPQTLSRRHGQGCMRRSVWLVLRLFWILGMQVNCDVVLFLIRLVPYLPSFIT